MRKGVFFKFKYIVLFVLLKLKGLNRLQIIYQIWCEFLCKEVSTTDTYVNINMNEIELLALQLLPAISVKKSFPYLFI